MAICNCVLWSSNSITIVVEGEDLFGINLLHSIHNFVHNICFGDENEYSVKDIGKVIRKRAQTWIS